MSEILVQKLIPICKLNSKHKDDVEFRNKQLELQKEEQKIQQREQQKLQLELQREQQKQMAAFLQQQHQVNLALIDMLSKKRGVRACRCVGIGRFLRRCFGVGRKKCRYFGVGHALR